MIVMTAVMLITKSKNIEMKGARGNIGDGRDKSRIKKKEEESPKNTGRRSRQSRTRFQKMLRRQPRRPNQ